MKHKTGEKDIETIYLEDLDYINLRLAEFLEDCGVDVKNKSLYSMINRLDDVVAVKDNKKYYSIQVDENNYITSVNKMDGIIEQQELPEDILRGYYVYQDGSFKIDEKKKLEWR